MKIIDSRTCQDRVAMLREEIRRVISPLISTDYRYLVLVDHDNAGDALICQGELDFLKTLPFRCKEMTTMASFSARMPKIPEDDLLIIRGGGCFGDVWPRAPAFWRMLIKTYPQNPILIMPQTIYFQHDESMREFAELCAGHKKLTICVRDRESLEIGLKYFENPVYLAPDMAFFCDLSPWRTPLTASKEPLFVYREDCEFRKFDKFESVLNRPDVIKSDWPTLIPKTIGERLFRKLHHRSVCVPRLYDSITYSLYRPYLLKSAVSFIDRHEEVYTTRMHAGILAVMLGKKTTFFDNSYGKTRRLFETWLEGCEDVSLIA